MEPVHSSDDAKVPRNGFLVELWDILKTVVVAFVIMMVLNMFVFNLSMVKGESMEPTLEEGERLFVNKIGYYFSAPKYGDVVVLKDPSQGPDKKPLLVKRVVALPGDTVEIRERQLFINGEARHEVYTDTAIEDGDIEPVTLEDGQYYVLGDNRHEGRSKDSRQFGAVGKHLIVGHAEFIFWPITKIRGL